MIDFQTLKSGDVVIFGGKLERTVIRVSFIPEVNDICVWFDDGNQLYSESQWFQISELKKPAIPEWLNFASLMDYGKYRWSWGQDVTPGKLLQLLKSDVARLEAAGVTPE